MPKASIPDPDFHDEHRLRRFTGQSLVSRSALWDRELNVKCDVGTLLDRLWVQRADSLNRIRHWFEGDQSIPPKEIHFFRSLYGYFVSSCRAIWPLLPLAGSRRGIEVAEQFLAGLATVEDVYEANWNAEGAAFKIEAAVNRHGVIGKLVDPIETMPRDELRTMLHPPHAADSLDARTILMNAAYFVDYAMTFPSHQPMSPPPWRYRVFLSASRFQELGLSEDFAT
jgi:hypothetical protein